MTFSSSLTTLITSFWCRFISNLILSYNISILILNFYILTFSLSFFYCKYLIFFIYMNLRGMRSIMTIFQITNSITLRTFLITKMKLFFCFYHATMYIFVFKEFWFNAFTTFLFFITLRSIFNI